MVSISIDWTLIAQLLTFLILMFIMNKILYKPILKILRERESEFEELKERAQVSKKVMEEGEAEASEKHTEVLRLAVKSYNTLKSEGQSREKEILETAQKEATTKLDTASQNLQKEIEDAKGDLKLEAQKIAQDIASKLLGRELPSTKI
jgi:F-type H+-transporting ATPase subunit b